jgi:glycosyltransferase involved in cell wall biosynthesis
MPSTRPLVSIITPTLNQGQFIEATLRSVAEQDYPYIEHIVVDGGSADATLDILRSWSAHPIRWLSEPDKGQADAINKGVRLARGEVCSWLNSDDIYLSRDVISRVVALFEAGARAVTGAGRYLDEDGSTINYIPLFADRLDRRSLSWVDLVLQPATFYETSLARDLPLDAELHWAFDWDFFIRLADQVTLVPLYEPLAGYRRHESAKTVSGGDRRMREIHRVLRRYHSPASPRLLFHVGAGQARIAAARLPRWLSGKVIYRLIDPLARRVDSVTGGVGIQT